MNDPILNSKIQFMTHAMFLGLMLPSDEWSDQCFEVAESCSDWLTARQLAACKKSAFQMADGQANGPEEGHPTRPSGASTPHPVTDEGHRAGVAQA